ncbi:MAG: hypothetical protein IJW13_04025 [Clostridia bacterium]|nr:hypothetical protein [Clostridia bacterium]
MKLKSMFVKAAALMISGAVVFSAGASIKSVKADTTYGNDLVTNGSLDGYATAFEGLPQTDPGTEVPVVQGAYEARTYDLHADAFLFEKATSPSKLILDGGETYLKLAYDGDPSKADTVDVWVQPGYLPAGTYTVKTELDIDGLSTGDYFEISFNGNMGIAGASLLNVDGYNALEDSATAGRKIMQYTVTLAEGTEWPATRFWFYHKYDTNVVAKIYEINYYDANGNVVYTNDFTAPFSKFRSVDLPVGYDYRAYNGLYSDGEGDFNIGVAQLVEETRLDGTVETYARLYDADKVSLKDSINMWVQPGFIPAGNYKVSIALEITDNITDYMRMFISKTVDGYSELASTMVDNAVAVYEFNKAAMVEYTYTLGADEQFNALNFWFQHKNQPNLELRIYSITYTNTQTTEIVYYNDFSSPFKIQGAQLGDGSLGFSDAKNTVVIKEKLGEKVNHAIQMNASSAFNTPIKIDGPGKYRVEMDVLPSDNYTGTLSGFFAAIDPTFNSGLVTVATNKSDFEFLEVGENGYYHFTGSVLVNNFMAKNVLSFYTTYTGAEGQYVQIDNIKIYKINDSVNQLDAPSTEGLEFRNLVLGGDFEYLPEGLTFVAEPTNDTYFWGSTSFDTPGVIVDMNGNKVLKIANAGAEDGAHRWASAFVFLDQSEYSLDKVYTLSYKMKYVGKEGFNPGIGLQVCFIGATGVEHYVQYLYYSDWLKESSGVNTDEWAYTIEVDENGWATVEMTFKMNSAFISQVDSIRFLNYNNADPDVVLYVDDVVFGVWEEPAQEKPDDSSSTGNSSNETPTTSENENSGNANTSNCTGSIVIPEVLVVCSLAAALFISKKKGRE